MLEVEGTRLESCHREDVAIINILETSIGTIQESMVFWTPGASAMLSNAGDHNHHTHETHNK